MKKIKTNLMLSFMVLNLFSNLIAGQHSDDPTPIDPYEMGKRIATLIIDENLENIVDELSNLELWSTIISTDSLLEVLYKPVSFNGNIMDDDENYNINSNDFISAKASVIGLVEENNKKPIEGSVIEFEDDEDPFIVLKVDTYKSVLALRKSPNVEALSMGGLISEDQLEGRSNKTNGVNRNDLFMDGLNTILNGEEEAKESEINCTYDSDCPPGFKCIDGKCKQC